MAGGPGRCQDVEMRVWEKRHEGSEIWIGVKAMVRIGGL